MRWIAAGHAVHGLLDHRKKSTFFLLLQVFFYLLCFPTGRINHNVVAMIQPDIEAISLIFKKRASKNRKVKLKTRKVVLASSTSMSHCLFAVLFLVLKLFKQVSNSRRRRRSRLEIFNKIPTKLAFRFWQKIKLLW